MQRHSPSSVLAAVPGEMSVPQVPFSGGASFSFRQPKVADAAAVSPLAGRARALTALARMRVPFLLPASREEHLGGATCARVRAARGLSPCQSTYSSG
ncbi:hypothetical protein NDU88_007098 [Pleurodeles waltl]|uniref:Uncharacterized protein n=1 Tax=Pleurodeles waltl TaxID=8319 RepID=A0AAV7VTG3_PLEWA|nr:hypothetical protein NDU88_007098 [Pleurodeles waltl]